MVTTLIPALLFKLPYKININIIYHIMQDKNIKMGKYITLFIVSLYFVGFLIRLFLFYFSIRHIMLAFVYYVVLRLGARASAGAGLALMRRACFFNLENDCFVDERNVALRRKAFCWRRALPLMPCSIFSNLVKEFDLLVKKNCAQAQGFCLRRALPLMPGRAPTFTKG